MQDIYERAWSAASLYCRGEDSHQSRNRRSYILLAEEVRRVSEDHKRDVIELFRRMCFNGLISNTDDHPRNHAMIAMDRPWRISPAYDLTPMPHVSQERRDLALICGDQGRIINTENLLFQARRFLLEPAEAQKTLADMRAQIAETWYATARREGISDADCEQIAPAFVYPGLDLGHVEPSLWQNPASIPRG